MSTILVVEDDVDLLRLLGEVLQAAGYRVVQAASGQQGLKLAQSTHPDLILCDIVMPEMDGNQMAAALRSCPGCTNIPIVGMSGQRSDMAHGFQYYVMFLRKPFSNNQLIETIIALIGPA